MNITAALWILGSIVVLSFPLVLGINSLLALQERIMVPLLRKQTAGGSSQTVSYKRHPHKPPVAVPADSYAMVISHNHSPREDSMISVDKLMTRSLINIQAGSSAIQAAKLMKDHKVGSVFVEQENRIVGIVTEPDIIRKVVGAERVPYYVPVEGIMSSPVIGIDGGRSITEAADMMEQHGTRHLAVLNGGAIVGVLSVRDLLHPVSIDEL